MSVPVLGWYGRLRGFPSQRSIRWRDAVAYCAWLANETGQPYRLPSEAEWEYACRAGTTTRYAFGDAITSKDANYSESKLDKTTEVGAYPPNAWGLHDMHVREWVEDIYHDSYQGAPTNGTAWIDGEEENSSRDRVNRGGSWNDVPWNLRSRQERTRHSQRQSRVPGCPDALIRTLLFTALPLGQGQSRQGSTRKTRLDTGRRFA
jgi:formylglycine-generating enzyme required for sulfatase activity